jgi:hypothetical protein
VGVRGDHAIAWPDGKAFAFTIFDDTDLATVERVAPVYALLTDLGLRTTKSVWAMEGEGNPSYKGSTSDDPVYLAWTLGLQAAGFEIGSHGATFSTSPREKVIESMDRFRERYGHDPATLANHTGCGEAIYWGADRLTGVNRLAYNVLTRFRNNGTFRGHLEGDSHFWGDICRARVRYVRNFTFTDIDTLAACPLMPYHDPVRPYVNHWFASTEGRNLRTFNERVTEASIDRLEASGGACVMYTHFASGFTDDGRLDPRFRATMERLAGKNGWFVPVATLLDFLLAQRGPTILTNAQRRSLERRWLFGKLSVGST